MSRNARQSGQFVVPGDKLGVVEEFLPGPGTYEQAGTVYSQFTGSVVFDMRNKHVSVQPTVRIPRLPREGDIVFGEVNYVQDKSATVSIAKINEWPLQGTFTGIIFISSSSPRFEENMADVCKVGDILRARVLNDKNRIAELGMADRGLGVIKAYCCRCGGLLIFKNGKLECRECLNVEHRRLAEDYGSVTVANLS